MEPLGRLSVLHLCLVHSLESRRAALSCSTSMSHFLWAGGWRSRYTVETHLQRRKEARLDIGVVVRCSPQPVSLGVKWGDNNSI